MMHEVISDGIVLSLVKMWREHKLLTLYFLSGPILALICLPFAALDFLRWIGVL